MQSMMVILLGLSKIQWYFHGVIYDLANSLNVDIATTPN